MSNIYLFLEGLQNNVTTIVITMGSISTAF